MDRTWPFRIALQLAILFVTLGVDLVANGTDANSQRSLSKDILVQKGAAIFDDPFSKGGQFLSLSGLNFSDSDLTIASLIPKVTYLRIVGSRFSDKALCQYVMCNDELAAIDMREASITDNGLTYIATSKANVKLIFLCVGGTGRITDESLAAIKVLRPDLVIHVAHRYQSRMN